MARTHSTREDRLSRTTQTGRVAPLRDVCATSGGGLCRLHYRRNAASIELQALSAVFAGLESVSILGGNEAKAGTDKFSYWAAEPREVFEFRNGEKDPFGRLHRILTKYRLCDNRPAGIPAGMFCGGWIGYFGYELGRYIEQLPATKIDDLQMPLIRLCFYDRFIAYDHKKGTFWLIALELPGDRTASGEKLAGLAQLLNEAQEMHIDEPTAVNLDDIDPAQFRCNMDKAYYRRMFEKIERRIYDGDVYQINFSQRFECDYRAEPVDLFHWQNRYNPSGYSAYINGGDFQIVSASPEMFLTISDGFISTKPIKGTRCRIRPDGANRLEAMRINEENFRILLSSEKERAELNMIVDLERNDLARICVPGSRRVIQSRTIEAYPTVFHAVATVAGRLDKNVSMCDCLKAMFPGGSITGAPKIRSMEIIDETEPTARGVYTGSIGYIGLDGNACLNIAIRTIIIAGQKAYAQTGGGIVADSDPQAEWNETITKARALLAGLIAVQSRTGYAN